MVSFNGPCLFVERKPSPCGKCAYSNLKENHNGEWKMNQCRKKYMFYQNIYCIELRLKLLLKYFVSTFAHSFPSPSNWRQNMPLKTNKQKLGVAG